MLGRGLTWGAYYQLVAQEWGLIVIGVLKQHIRDHIFIIFSEI